MSKRRKRNGLSKPNESSNAFSTLNTTMTAKTYDRAKTIVSGLLETELKRFQLSRSTYYHELNKYHKNYITNAIYDIITNDIFSVDDIDNINIIVESKDVSVEDNPELYKKYSEIQDELNKLISDLDLVHILCSVLPDLLHYGTYPLVPVIEDGVGIIEIRDDYDPYDVIAATKNNGEPLFFFICEQPYGTDESRTIKFADNTTGVSRIVGPDDIILLSLDLSFIKFKLPNNLINGMRTAVSDQMTLLTTIVENLKIGNQDDREKAVEAQNQIDDLKNLKDILNSTIKIRTSSSFIWNSIDKLKDVLLTDKIRVLRNISNLLSPNILGVPVPSTNDVDEMKRVADMYDEIINSNNALATDYDSIQSSIDDIVRVRVVPISGERSIPQSLDTGKESNTIDSSKLAEDLELLLQSLSIPMELFVGEKNDVDNIKTNIRYAKKIKKIIHSISKFVQLTCRLHIRAKYDMDIPLNDIKVRIKSTNNIDELESSESQDLLTSSINSMLGLIESLEQVSEKSNYKVDYDKFMKKVRDSLDNIGSPFADILVLNEDSTNDNVISTDVSYPIDNNIGASEYTEPEDEGVQNE